MNIRIITGNIIGYLFLLFWKLNQYRDSRSYHKILSVYFHNPEKKVFNGCIDFLLKNKYKIISLEELTYYVENKVKPLQKSAYISLDDAWKDNLINVIPKADENDIFITIFTPIGAVKDDGVLWLKYFRDKQLVNRYSHIYPELKSNIKKISEKKRRIIFNIIKDEVKYPRELMNIDEIKLISDKIDIQSHTYSHSILTNCDDSECVNELQRSKQEIENLTNKPVVAIAYPNGNYDESVIRNLKRVGYKMAFTVEAGQINILTCNPYKMHRNCVPDNFGKFESISRMLGIWYRIF